ncbi:5-hydroxytryptamine receptor 1B-like [Amphiura filiformis]|uniref:5-hydroxytryptamine receptor 1B-like n=1 Tax=Amphiura filiformis TaxID=82378 RepID=UPI003B210C26
MNTTNVSESTDVFIVHAEAHIAYSIFLPLLTLLTIVANLGIITAFWKVSSLREKPSNLLILCLSFVDLIQGLLFLPIMSHFQIIGIWIFGEIGCQLWIAIGTITSVTSIFLLVAISLDRLLLISLTYPRYVKLLLKSRIKVTAILCLICALIPTFTELVVWQKAKSLDIKAESINFELTCLSPTRRVVQFQFFMIIFSILPFFVVVIFTCTFFIRLRRITKSNRVGGTHNHDGSLSSPATGIADKDDESNNAPAGISHKPSTSHRLTTGPEESLRRIFVSEESGPESGSRARYIKPAITLSALVLAMITCLMPYNLYVIVIIPVCSKCYDPRLVSNLGILIFCNPLFDAVFYGVTQGKIRGFYLAQIRGIYRQMRQS